MKLKWELNTKVEASCEKQSAIVEENGSQTESCTRTKTFHIHFDFSILSSLYDAVRSHLPEGQRKAARENKIQAETKGERERESYST